MDKKNGLQRISNYIRSKTLQLFRYRIILVGVLVFAAPIWAMDQGQDLLINSNSKDAGVVLFLGVVMVAAFLNWYLAKLFFEKKYIGPVCPFLEPAIANPALLKSEKKVSRFLGIATIIIPAIAILNALAAIRVRHPLDFLSPNLWLVIWLALFYFLVKFDLAGRCYLRMEHKIGQRKSKAITLGVILLLGFVMPLIIRFWMIGGQNNTPPSLIFLFLHLVLLCLAFYLFVTIRTCIFSDSGWMRRRVGIPILLAGALLAGGFIFLNLFPLFTIVLDRAYLSLPVVLTGVVFYTLAFTLLVRVSLWTRVNFVLFLFIIGLVISLTVNNNFHAVKRRPVTTPPSQPALTQYFRNWLLARQKEIDNSPSTYPVFLINSYGGGIRSAAFTNMTLSWLDSVMISESKAHKAFEHYVFSISGASGGTIGAAVQCAYRAAWLDGKISNNPAYGRYALDEFTGFYRHDFLTPVLSDMLGRDTWASASSFHLWKDRSEIQENLWEHYANTALHLDLDREFNAIWDTSSTNPSRYEVPLLFSNTLNVDDGLKGIMAPVRLEHGDFPATIFIRERIDSLNAQRSGKDSPQSINLMTGAFLSARFPFISPSGRMGPGYHFMDGGGKDNSGASTSENIFIALTRYGIDRNNLPEDSTFYRLIGKVRFYFVSISNSPYFDPDSNRHLVSNRFEPISPIVGIINSGISGNARASDSTIRFRYIRDSSRLLCLASDYCSIWPTATYINDEKGVPYSPILPLGWQISEPSLQRLRACFTDEMVRSYDPIGMRKIFKIMGIR